jgi:hypothetical protein
MDEYPYDCSPGTPKPDPQSIASELELSRQAHNDSIVLLEGDTDDYFYGQFFDKNNCKTIPVCGKKNVINTIPLVNNLKGILGIVDADFSHIDGQECNNPNLLRTDFHDIETMMIASEALDKIIKNFADIRELKKFEEDRGKKIRQILLDEGYYIAHIRKYSQKNKKGWDFKHLVFSNFISTKNLEINIDLFHEDLKRNNFDLRNENKQHLLPRLYQEFKKLPNPISENQWQLCNGHDLVRILFIGLDIIFPHQKQKLYDYFVLERELRIAYYDNLFNSTILFSDIIKWERSNPPFIILGSHKKVEISVI